MTLLNDIGHKVKAKEKTTNVLLLILKHPVLWVSTQMNLQSQQKKRRPLVTVSVRISEVKYTRTFNLSVWGGGGYK